MEPVQRPEDLVLTDIAAFTRPVLRVFDEKADRRPDVAFDRGEHSHHPASAADLHVQPLLPVGRGDPLLVDLRKVIERERVLEALFQAADRLGESLAVIVDESGGRPPGAFCVLSRENTRKNRLKVPMGPRVFFPSVFAA